MKSWKLPLHHCVILTLWTSAESCWRLHFSSAKCSWAQENTTALRIWRRYTSLSILTTWSKKTWGVLPMTQIPPQTKTYRCSTMEYIPGACADKILSFWRLCDCSTLNNFSSDKMIFSQHVPSARCWSWRHRWRRTRFSYVRNCPFCRLYGWSPSSFFAIWRTDSRETPIFLAIFLMETNAFFCNRFLIIRQFWELFTVRFLPLPGRSP